jgi:hypothetical protein
MVSIGHRIYSRYLGYCRIDLIVSLAASVYLGLPILIASPKEIGVVVLELWGVASVKTSYQHLHGRVDASLLVVVDQFILELWLQDFGPQLKRSSSNCSTMTRRGTSTLSCRSWYDAFADVTPRSSSSTTPISLGGAMRMGEPFEYASLSSRGPHLGQNRCSLVISHLRCSSLKLLLHGLDLLFLLL